MRLCWVVLLCAALSTLSCFSHAANQRYKHRVAELDSLYYAGEADIEAAHKKAVRQIKTLRTALVAVRPRQNMMPVDPVRSNPELQRAAVECDAMQKAQSADAVQCWATWNQDFIKALIAVYWAADLTWIVTAMKSDPDNSDLESLFVYSHNLRLQAYLDAELEAAADRRIEALEQLATAYNAAVASAAQLRDAEIEQARREFAAGMAIVAQSLSRSSTTASSTSTAYGAGPVTYGAATNGCTSDYTCGIGYTCVKANYAGAGYCARAVNEYGVQTFDLPDMNSVFVKVPKDTDCTFATDCPIGFRCDRRSGACLR